MNVSDLIASIPAGYKDFAVVIGLLSLVEVSPIKINPWQWLKSFIELPKRLDYIEACRWRQEILRFSDTVRKGFLYSKETWDDILDSISQYEHYCRTHKDFKNGKTVAATEFLHRAHQRCLDKNEFLQ